LPGETVVLGVDPGLNITGYGVVALSGRVMRLVDAGVLKPAPGLPLPLRLRELHRDLGEIMETHRPAAMAIEQVYSHYRHPRTAIIMGHARGVLCLAAAQRDIPVKSIPATHIKKAVTGRGRAGKEQVNGMVCRLLGIPGPLSPMDVSDALAAAIAYCEEETDA
jgi:crossover junction endodeoxyribonuclease RuvC